MNDKHKDLQTKESNLCVYYGAYKEFANFMQTLFFVLMQM